MVHQSICTITVNDGIIPDNQIDTISIFDVLKLFITSISENLRGWQGMEDKNMSYTTYRSYRRFDPFVEKLRYDIVRCDIQHY